MRTRKPLGVVVGALLATAVQFLASMGLAQGTTESWPQRTVRFIVPFGPGSASDTAGRLLAERLQKVWSQPVIVENKPGGDGLLSIGAFVSAKDDHTLLLTPSTVFLVHPYTQENLSYDAQRDLNPISWISSTPIGVAVTSTMPVSTMKEFVEHARRQNGKLNYAVGVGFLEFVWDGFRREHNVPMVKVPFRDIVQAPLELAEGRIDVLMTSVATHRPMLQSGKTKLLAIGDPKRSELTPGIPTVVEAGYPGLQTLSMNLLFGPAHMPLALRQRASNDIAALLRQKELADRLRTSGQQEVGGGPDELAKVLAEQHAQVARIAGVLGVSRKR